MRRSHVRGTSSSLQYRPAASVRARRRGTMSDGAKPAEDEAVEAKPWVKEPERFVPAHDCLRLRFVGGAAGSVAAALAGDSFATEPAPNSFTPQYVHQIFDNGAALRPTHLARAPCTQTACQHAYLHPHSCRATLARALTLPDPSPDPNPDQRPSSCHRPRAL
eukprot:scaffold93582_cov61-Phaeocystis_antarctica.AAC.2